MLKRALQFVGQRYRSMQRLTRLKTRGPKLTEENIIAALRSLPLNPPKVLLVHSSLSACGRIDGGAAAVIRTLRRWNDGGALAMPTHTYCYPLHTGDSPVFHPCTSGSVVGAITEEFRKIPGVARSLHPTHSLACEGSCAESIVAGHEACDTPCGRGTPYERLIQHDAAVLMFGASLETYTLFHTAEDAADVPTLYESRPVTLRFRSAEGSLREMQMRRQDMTVPRSFREKDDWLAERGLLYRTRLGRGELLLIPHARSVHEAVVEELRSDPTFLMAR